MVVSWLAAGLVFLGVIVIAVPTVWIGLNGVQQRSDEEHQDQQSQRENSTPMTGE